MLTQQEKDWLERRKKLCSRCEFCLYDNPCVRYGTKGKRGRCEGFWPRNMAVSYTHLTLPTNSLV